MLFPKKGSKIFPNFLIHIDVLMLCRKFFKLWPIKNYANFEEYPLATQCTYPIHIL